MIAFAVLFADDIIIQRIGTTQMIDLYRKRPGKSGL
jgi:hypothetical protein